MTDFRSRLRRQWALRPERNIQLAIAIVAVLLFVSPVISVVFSAFRTSPFCNDLGKASGCEWTLDPFIEVMSKADTWESLGASLILTVVSVAIGIVLATFFATIVSRTNAIWKWLITGTMAILVATPPLFYALTWTMLGNKSVGLLNVWIRGLQTGWAEGYQWGDGPLDMASWPGLIFVSTVRGVAFMFLVLIGPFSSMDRTLEEAARVSGAGPIRTFFGTQLRVLTPAIISVLIVSTVASLEAFDVPVILGVPSDIYVLPTEVFKYLNDAREPLYGQASAVSLILLAILLVLLVTERLMYGRRRFTTVGGKGARNAQWSLGKWRVPVFVFTLLYFLIVVALPTTQLVLVAMSPYFGATEGWTFDNFGKVLADPATLGTFGYTAGIAAMAAFLAVVAVVVFLWASRLRRGALAATIDMSQMGPLAVPGLLLGLGLITVVLATPLKGSYGSWGLLMVGLFISIVPLAARSISGAIVQIPQELEEATRVSGGNRARALVDVVFRLLVPSALNAWLLCFVVISGSLAIPLLLSQRGSTLLAVKVYETYSAGDFVKSAVYFVIFIAEILLVTLVIEIIKRLLALRVGGRKSYTPGKSTDPEWTGSVSTRPQRGTRSTASTR